jgi:hypothetical protein
VCCIVLCLTFLNNDLDCLLVYFLLLLATNVGAGLDITVAVFLCIFSMWNYGAKFGGVLDLHTYRCNGICICLNMAPLNSCQHLSSI